MRLSLIQAGALLHGRKKARPACFPMTRLAALLATAALIALGGVAAVRIQPAAAQPGRPHQSAAPIPGEYSNLYVHISQPLVNMFLAREVNEQTYVNETLLGSFTRGQTITKGAVNVEFTPRRDGALVNFH